MRKILLLVRIKSQNTTTLSRQVYEECKSQGWPGLGKEVSEICEEIGLPDVTDVSVTKAEIKEKIWNHHMEDIKSELSKSKKMMIFQKSRIILMIDHYTIPEWHSKFGARCWPRFRGILKQVYFLIISYRFDARYR